jgi:hypothetical protein
MPDTLEERERQLIARNTRGERLLYVVIFVAVFAVVLLGLVWMSSTPTVGNIYRGIESAI